MYDFTKRVAQSFLAAFGAKLSRIPLYVQPEAPIDVFDYVLAKHVLETGAKFRFIQVGANDGVYGDSLAPQIRKYHLTGCLVEPIPDIFERLKENYRDSPQLVFCNCMIGSEGGKGEIYRFKPDAPVPHEFYHGLARQDSEYIYRRARGVGLADYVEKVQCIERSFASLIRELGYQSLDLLFIDTEGSDDKIIYQVFAAGFYPKLIHYEWSEMSLTRNCELKTRLVKEGYRFIDLPSDTLCVKQ